MKNFLSKLRKPKVERTQKEFPYSIKIKDGVFEYGVKKISMTKEEFKKFWKVMPKKDAIKNKEFEDLADFEKIIVPEIIYKNPFLENGLIKKSGLNQASSM